MGLSDICKETLFWIGWYLFHLLHYWVYSETTLTGESRFHISTSLGIEPGSLMTGSKQVDHWTSGTVYKCSEIAGSLQVKIYNMSV